MRTADVVTKKSERKILTHLTNQTDKTSSHHFYAHFSMFAYMRRLLRASSTERLPPY